MGLPELRQILGISNSNGNKAEKAAYKPHGKKFFKMEEMQAPARTFAAMCPKFQKGKQYILTRKVGGGTQQHPAGFSTKPGRKVYFLAKSPGMNVTHFLFSLEKSGAIESYTDRALALDYQIEEVPEGKRKGHSKRK